MTAKICFTNCGDWLWRMSKGKNPQEEFEQQVVAAAFEG